LVIVVDSISFQLPITQLPISGVVRVVTQALQIEVEELLELGAILVHEVGQARLELDAVRELRLHVLVVGDGILDVRPVINEELVNSQTWSEFKNK